MASAPCKGMRLPAALVILSLAAPAAGNAARLARPVEEYESIHPIASHFSACEGRPQTDAAGALVEALAPVIPHDADGMLVTIDANGRSCTMAPITPGQASRDFQDASRRARRPFGMVHRERTIAYVNGMKVTPDIECETLREIQAVTGAAVVGIYNATDGLAEDAFESARERSVIEQHLDLFERYSTIVPLPVAPSQDKPVQTLKRIILGETLAGRPPEIWAHSQGAAIASLALVEAKELLAKKGKSLDGIRVTSFAGAAPMWPDGPTYEHYIHTRDAVPRYTGLGRLGWFDRFNAGARAKVIRFSGSFVHFSGADGGMPSFTDHHDVLAVYLPRWMHDHGQRPASLIPPERW